MTSEATHAKAQACCSAKKAEMPLKDLEGGSSFPDSDSSKRGSMGPALYEHFTNVHCTECAISSRHQ
jgi:hypothetical protein